MDFPRAQSLLSGQGIVKYSVPLLPWGRQGPKRLPGQGLAALGLRRYHG